MPSAQPFSFMIQKRASYSRVLLAVRVLQRFRIRSTTGIAGAVYGSGMTEIINDTNQDPRFNQEVDRRTGFRTRNILYVPLRNRLDQTIGVAQVLDKHEGCFTQLDAASAIIRRQRSPSSTRRLPPTRQDSNAICSATGIRQSGISVTLSMRHRRIVLLGFLSIVADTTATIRHWMPGTAFGSWSRKVAVHHHGQPRQRES